MIDIHCHILPLVDDGAKNFMSAKKMLRIASDEGIDIIVATPHFSSGMDDDKQEKVRMAYQHMCEWCQKKDLGVELYLGNELFYSESIIEELNAGHAFTMNGTRYVLVEFPIYIDFSYIKRAVQKLRYAGYIPILAHIERYECLDKKEKIQELVEQGAYVQVNASAVCGKHGFFKKRFLLQLMKRDLVHFVGTDAHNTHKRKPELYKCAVYLEKKLGVTKTQQILEENPQKMLKGEELDG